MGEFGISGLIKEGELEKLEQCDAKLIKIKNTYVDVARACQGHENGNRDS